MALDAAQYDLRATLVPFVARVLHYGESRSYSPGPWPLPVGHPELYFEDDVEGLKAVLPQGVLYAFCTTASGWAKRPVLVGAEAWSSAPRLARLWEVSAGFQLHFTPQSVLLAEGVFNVVARWPRDHQKHPRYRDHTPDKEIARLTALTLPSMGDAAFAYWLLTGVWSEIDPTPAPGRVRLHGDKFLPVLTHFGRMHPLLDLRYGPTWGWTPQPPAEGVLAGTLESFISGPLRGVLPWWMAHALEHWRSLKDAVWEGGHTHLIALRTGQAERLERWIKAICATGWLHLLLPIVEHLAWEQQQLVQLGAQEVRRMATRGEVPAGDTTSSRWLASAAVARIDLEFRDQRQAERFAAREAWARLLAVGGVLHDAWVQVMRVHPVDRDAHQAWFASTWAQRDLGALTDQLAEIARGIEGRLG